MCRVKDFALMVQDLGFRLKDWNYEFRACNLRLAFAVCFWL